MHRAATLMGPNGECSSDSLDAVCGSGETCAKDGTHLNVRFNSRSYALSAYDGACASSTRRGHNDDFRCVDYGAGALKLAGRTLSFTVDLSSAGCGCKVAMYLVAMPQNTEATSCHDYYCDANSVRLPPGLWPCPRRAPPAHVVVE